MKARALQGEVQLVDVPGRPTITLTRSEAIDFANSLISELKLPEPWIPRLSLWRRLRDRLRRLLDADTRRQEEALRKRAQALLDAGSVRRV